MPDQDSRSADSPARAFFGRRKGHRLRSHQAGLVADLLPQLSLDLAAPPPAALTTLFAAPVDTVRIEIGFGGGEHLVAETQAHPRGGFIGVEPYVNGMAKILAAIAEAPPGNLRLLAGDAAQLLAWVPAGSLARIDLIHPDPWPKRRHWKRRFVQDATVDAMARALRPGGEFRFVCDIAHYTGWTLAHLARHPAFDWTAERADDWRQPWPGYTLTRYGRKAQREGRKASYLVFRRR
jgi:tRNA (guanine-N7-)-methyltransferase